MPRDISAKSPTNNTETKYKAPDLGDLLRQIILITIWVFSLPVKMVKGIDKNYLNPLAIIIAGAMISVSIVKAGGIPTSKTAATTVTGGATAPTQPNAAQPPSAAAAKDVPPLSGKDHIRGSKTAQILLIEYSDLECPFCKRFHPTAQQVVDQYKGKVAWVYRHFPLDPIHSKADKEAEASECAAELGGEDAFWKYVDKVYEVTPSNNGLDPAELPKIASSVGLDSNKFKTCLDSGKYAAKVEEQYQGGIKAGVTGTPGNILLNTKNGKTKLIPGAVPYDTIKSSIDSLLSES